ncbi:HD-GYP domain-containing protein [Cohnella hashimotonis]|uniref:HD domain-containing phosphohydrolase n=1 Tax=Cohnella hashimotonis TaxID=2826895 RepID=A0ABT6TIV6_9BACL|nr:HD domain-containing phosphohydrolase [Cohnella hashimotonis]MDI4646755.1 HD domain-containing phosphohydrolase [Cohnella hashimotonis]
MQRKDLTSEQLLTIIFEYMAKISSESKLDKVLVLMANMGREMIVADRCTVWLIDEARSELYTTVAHGVKEIRIPIGSGLVGHAIATGEPVIIEDARHDPRHNAENDRKTGYQTKSIITIPFRNNDGETIGAYQAINKMTEAGKFTDYDMNLLSLAASYAGKSLESVMLHQEIADTQREIISTMGEIGEIRSKETGNHVRRVAEYSYVLAKAYGLSGREAETLRDVSPMHDIGKVAIPDAVLNKPGKLTDEEYDIIKSHTRIGHQLLKGSRRELLAAAAIIAEQHHEKWDGSGYPNGLAGEDIHIFGRITAVADVFDALSAERVYKAAWPLDRIEKLFREERGRHFDPAVVDVFFDKLGELVDIRDRLNDGMNEETG